MIRDPDPGIASERQKRKLSSDEFSRIVEYVVVKDLPM
jgi:hypothetical protein